MCQMAAAVFDNGRMRVSSRRLTNRERLAELRKEHAATGEETTLGLIRAVESAIEREGPDRVQDVMKYTDD